MSSQKHFQFPLLDFSILQPDSSVGPLNTHILYRLGQEGSEDLSSPLVSSLFWSFWGTVSADAEAAASTPSPQTSQSVCSGSLLHPLQQRSFSISISHCSFPLHSSLPCPVLLSPPHPFLFCSHLLSLSPFPQCFFVPPVTDQSPPRLLPHIRFACWSSGCTGHPRLISMFWFWLMTLITAHGWWRISTTTPAF